MVGERFKKGIDFAKSITSQPSNEKKKKPKTKIEKVGTIHERVDYYCILCNNLVGSKKQIYDPFKFVNNVLSFGEDKDTNNLRSCLKCGHWVCDNCWNDDTNECDKCSPISSPDFRKDSYGQYFFECKKCGREFGPGSNKKEGRKFLNECIKCNKWVCGECWNHNMGICGICSPLPITDTNYFEGTTEPEMRIDKTTATPKYFFICSQCRVELGYGLGPEDARRYLAQCPDCKKWFCTNHWNTKKIKCLNCAPDYPPETRTSSTTFGPKIFFMCSKCKKEVGSIAQKKWRMGEEKKYLTQCLSCGKWVCGDCWNSEIGECNKCSPFSPPEIRTTKSAKKSQTYFICHKCRNEFGPYEERDWVAISKIAYHSGRATFGLATLNPFESISGIFSTVMDLHTTRTPNLLPTTITAKELEKLKTMDLSKKFLAPCPKCKKWVCKGCWNAEKGECTICSPCDPDKTAAAISIKQDVTTQSEFEHLGLENPMYTKATAYLTNIYSRMTEYTPVYSPLGFYVADKKWDVHSDLANLNVVGIIISSPTPLSQKYLIMECKYIPNNRIHKQVLRDMEHAEKNKLFSAVCYITDSIDETADFFKSYKHPSHSIYLYDLANDRIIHNENDEKTILFSYWFKKEDRPMHIIELIQTVADKNGNFTEKGLIVRFRLKERECKRMIIELLNKNKIVKIVDDEYTFVNPVSND